MSTWDKLSVINVNKHVERKGSSTYLSWAWAWGIVKENFPDANYKVKHWDDSRPYLFDNILGYLVETEVTIDGETIGMHLPVMDSSHKAQRDVDYSYRTNSGEKTCLAASMFDINTTIMRCLTKNLAMFGLGHYIYAGEDLPHESDEMLLEKYTKRLRSATTEEGLRHIFSMEIPKDLRLRLTAIKDEMKASIILTEQQDGAA